LPDLAAAATKAVLSGPVYKYGTEALGGREGLCEGKRIGLQMRSTNSRHAKVSEKVRIAGEGCDARFRLSTGRSGR